MSLINYSNSSGKWFSVTNKPVAGNHPVIAVTKHHTTLALVKSIVQKFVSSGLIRNNFDFAVAALKIIIGYNRT
ncbi:MAG: hypothetical protein BWY67_02317 [Bacteroidetes bacterium ADurb.Bin397]|nr:MAG: hypothetical protein BWY67_02317 [Bacteroidetes bacterium ADurb.Bin397]